MRVLLVQPRPRRRPGFRAGFRTMAVVEPLGLEMVAGALSAEHQVQLVDMLPGADLEAALERFAPDVCGLSCSFTVDVPETLLLAQAVKARRPQTFVFVGGHHASLCPDDFQVPWVDAVVFGEGESTAPDLLHALERGDDLAEVPGLILNTSDGQLTTPPREIIGDLDSLPFPARSLVRDSLKSYHLGLRSELSSVETSRGCPYRCTFCSVWHFYQSQVRAKSPERVLAEIEAIEGRHLFVTDDNFLADISRAERIAELLLERGIKKRFIYQARTDSIARHPETVTKLREAGFATAFVGLEKIDAEGLRSIHKGNTVENNEAALRVLRRAGVNVFGTLIVDPDYDESDFRRLREYVRSHALVNAWFTILTPLPGTILYDKVRETITTRKWELYDLAHAVVPTRLELDRFYSEFARLYKSTYAPRAIARWLWHSVRRADSRRTARTLSPAILWRCLETFRCMTDPREYLAAHAQRE